ncbi:MAG: Hg(II)-responsive transcriptional regulator [Vicinamibacterales bacterium]
MSTPSSSHDREFSIGTLAAAASVNVETIRFYQRKGLLSQPRRAYGQMRRYSDADLARVRFIKAAQRLGFSLEEIAGLLRLEDGTHCDDARLMAEEKLRDVEAKRRDLDRIARLLRQLVGACRHASDRVACPIIDALQHPTPLERPASPHR